MPTQVNKTFCIFPFIQTVVRTNGSMGPCCRIKTAQNINSSTIEEFWHSDTMNSMRQNMLEGERFIPECQLCYDEEMLTGKSMRVNALNDYKFFNHRHTQQLLNYHNLNNTAFPNRIEMHLGNLCNLKCLTCNPGDSSAFLAENRVLGISDHSQKDYQLDDKTIWQILDSAMSNDIKILDLRGGESMIMPSIKKILLKWPDSQAQHITLRIQTNCTTIDEDWKTIFKKFDKLEIMMSVDAWGKDNEYIRFPSVWTDIEQNIMTLANLKNANAYINCTVSNLNFLVLPKLINWCKEKNIYFHWSLLQYPGYFCFNNMPEELFNQGKQNLSGYTELKSLMSHQYNDALWTDFCNTISQRDNYRNNSIFNIIPEFKTHWRNK